jgi:hypothetical protein
MKDPTRYIPDTPEDEQAATEALLYQTLTGVNSALASTMTDAIAGKRIEDLANRTVGKRLLRHTERAVFNLLAIGPGVDIVNVVRGAWALAFPGGFDAFNNDATNPGSYEDLILGGLQVEINVSVANPTYNAAQESRLTEKGIGQFLSLAMFPSNDQRNPLVEFTEAQHLANTHPVPPVLWVDRKAQVILNDNGGLPALVPAGLLCNVGVSIQIHADFWTPEYFADNFTGGAAMIQAARKMIKG